LADQHTEGADDEERATAELLNGVEGYWSRADVDKSEDQGDQEGVADGIGRLEERCGVVEDEVDTSPINQLAKAKRVDKALNSPLLHHLKRGTQDGAA
jgi:hypothetical protein